MRMPKYIKRKSLVDLVLSKLMYLGDARIMNQNDEKVLSEIDGYEKAMQAVHELILDKDLIEDVQPVIHAYWIELSKALNPNENPCKCSNCGHVLSFYNGYPKSKYCPNCGARMEMMNNERNKIQR